jgi:uncharacterized protein (TIGR03085 family)
LFARRERLALCECALAAGPSAPTLCEGWTVLDLVVHLLVRERRPLAAPGVIVPRLAGLVDRASERLARQPFPRLVEQLRTPPLPLRAAPIEGAVNTAEFFVHHEDIRRAQPSWTPRTLDPADERTLWRSLATAGRMLVRPAGLPVVIESGPGRAVLRRGDAPVVVSGPVGDLTLFLFGRDQVAGLSFDGPADRVAELRAARLGF